MDSKLMHFLRERFGFTSFKGEQQAIIENLMSGKNVFVVMPTGGGKSLCYQLPALLMDGTAIVLSPLIALMKNQVDAIRGYCSEDSIAHVFNSSLTKSQLDEVKQDVIEGKTKLLYVAPESLSKEDNIDFFKTINTSFFAIDEAHCISEWGHDFRPEYRRIRPIIDRIGTRPIIALTATATPKVQHDIIKNLSLSDVTVFKSSFNRPNLFFRIEPKTEHIDKDIIQYIRKNRGKSGIIYCMSRNKVASFAALLQENGIKALPYHAGLDAKERSANQDAFISETCEVIVATIAFGMGIDKPDVRYVIHYDMPKSIEAYYQETGRAGRDGGEGVCIAYYCKEDIHKLEKFLINKNITEQEINKQLLAEISAYAQTGICRRSYLLHYFGEEYPEDSCGNCDNCTMVKKKEDAQEALEILLEAILELKEKFQANYIINVLEGNLSADIETFKHDETECFGSGGDISEEKWKAIIEQAVVGGYLKKDVENYGVLSLTAKGKKFLKSPSPFTLVYDEDPDDMEEEDLMEQNASEAADAPLFSMMKVLRKNVAQRYGVPPYVVFRDDSLTEMATLYPTTIEELQNIPGVGAGKAKRYGQEFLDLIRQHLEENDIERPFDFPVRTIFNKSKLRSNVVQQIDHRIPFEDIAYQNDLDIDELLNVIESIVFGGTKINIDYELEYLMDEDEIQEIYDYFKNSESDDVELAIKELDNLYEEEEIRLVRIKFISEQAN